MTFIYFLAVKDFIWLTWLSGNWMSLSECMLSEIMSGSWNAYQDSDSQWASDNFPTNLGGRLFRHITGWPKYKMHLTESTMSSELRDYFKMIDAKVDKFRAMISARVSLNTRRKRSACSRQGTFTHHHRPMYSSIVLFRVYKLIRASQVLIKFVVFNINRNPEREHKWFSNILDTGSRNRTVNLFSGASRKI